METPPNESSNQEPASGDELVDQAGIDALLNGAGADEQTAPSAAPGEQSGSDTEAPQGRHRREQGQDNSSDGLWPPW